MSSLKGSLESISLTDVAQLLHINRKSGMLQVTSGRQSGVLWFQNGEIVHAETAGAKGETAAYEVLEWDTGSFEFLSTSAQAPTTIRRNVQDLLMDSARMADSRRRLLSVFPDMDAVPWPKLSEPKLTEGLKMYSEDRKVLPFLDGYRSFREVMETANLTDVSVLQTASLLKDADRLEVLSPSRPVTVGVLKTGLFKKGDHLELSKTHEAAWRAMGPYQGGVANLRVVWPQGPAVEAVRFVAGMDDSVVAIPREFMQAWDLAEGTKVQVRPAP